MTTPDRETPRQMLQKPYESLAEMHADIPAVATMTDAQRVWPRLLATARLAFERPAPPSPAVDDAPAARFHAEQRGRGWTIYDRRQPSGHIGTMYDEFDAKALCELLNDLYAAARGRRGKEGRSDL